MDVKGRFTRIIAAVLVPAGLLLTGCGTSLNDIFSGAKNAGSGAADGAAGKTADHVTNWAVTYPKVIVCIGLFLFVMTFGRKIISDWRVRVVLAFAAGIAVAVAIAKSGH